MVSDRPAPHDVAQTGTPDQLADPRDEPRRRLGRPKAACPTTRRPASRRAPRRSARPRRARRCRAASRPAVWPPSAVADADPDALEPRQHVELRQREPFDPRGADGEPQRRKVEPAAAARPPGDRAELVAALAQQIAGRVAELGRERTAADAGRVALRDSQDGVDRGRADAQAGARAARRRRRRRHERIRAVVDVQQHALRALEHDVVAAHDRVVHQLRGVARCTAAAPRRARGSAAAISVGVGRGAAQRREQRRQRLDLARELRAEALGVQADRRREGRCAPPCSRRSGRCPCGWCRSRSRRARRAADRSRGDTAASGARAPRRPDCRAARGTPARGTPAPLRPAPPDRPPSPRRARR